MAVQMGDDSTLPTTKLTSASSFIAGATAGLVCDATVFPMDTIRVRQQARHWPASSAIATESFARPDRPAVSMPQRYSLISEAVAILKHEGARGFYKGLSVVMLTSCPAFGIYYSAYEFSKSKLRPATGWSSDAIHLASGAIANVFGMVIWTPQEVIKSQTQVQVKTAVSPRHIVIDIYREYGIRGFYRGVVIGSLTWTPLSAIWFMTYERLKPLNFGRDELARDGSVSAAWLALSGFIAGVVACTTTSPIDVVKTQYQVAGRGIASSSSSQFTSSRSSSIRDIAIALLRNEGVRGFFRGVCAKSLWYGTFMAINITVYDRVRLSLQGFHT
ncbi:mitoferrin-1, putative [Perkinsus marinus ATCC 50983]|uniref:Mitoferrin-1, putative n=1 Tax=Perkinsus marinus (strain ATCC 50983 / TXsc) TaxID=423536 RepID=C5KD91_PERM5|nr:mitoferrin-1, putative [Perkinsus marinus ATCC 50983]EER17524.1 mitoferrin-1, putative [Perkinsus marinus ATCC 50983]|eukprot:XP_002785728.1 mitoferrin-1, putative [Perkinsus marinus ATCC 50983]